MANKYTHADAIEFMNAVANNQTREWLYDRDLWPDNFALNKKHCEFDGNTVIGIMKAVCEVTSVVCPVINGLELGSKTKDEPNGT